MEEKSQKKGLIIFDFIHTRFLPDGLEQGRQVRSKGDKSPLSSHLPLSELLRRKSRPRQLF